ncbi:hypothetical protein [Alkalicoccobacillus gibsonii]
MKDSLTEYVEKDRDRTSSGKQKRLMTLFAEEVISLSLILVKL